MKILAKIACTTLATTALLGVAGVTAASAAEVSSTAAAAATATVAEQPMQSAAAPTTKQFLIRNLSGYTLKLRNLVTAEQRQDNSELPADGTVVLPGQQLPMEMTYYFLANNRADVRWDVLDPDGQVRGYGETAMNLTSLNLKNGGVVSQWGPAVFAATGDGDVAVTDREATTYDIPGGEGQRQLDVLNRYCEAGVAQCSFAIKSEKQTFGPSRPFKVIEYNNTPHQTRTVLSDKQTITATDTFTSGMSLKGSILGLVETTFNASYSHTWLKSHEFSWTRELVADPYTKTWLQVAPPIIEFTGDFTVTAGKTTWILRDVVFTTPDKGGVEHWFHQQIPLTEAEKATALSGATPETPAEAIARAADEGVAVTTTPLD